MKRSRRVMLTLMGSAALTAVAGRLEARPLYCRPDLVVTGPDGRPVCRGATYGGFGGSLHHIHGHGPGHFHAGG